jgi:hypothetical protein
MTRPSALDTVRRELESAIAELRSSVAIVRARAAPTDQEREAFVGQALSGALGAHMFELGRRLRAGDTTWAGVLEGTSPDSEMLREHARRMLDEHGPAILEAVARPPGGES